MSDPVFFRRSASPTVAEIATWLRADVPDGADLSAVITGIAPVDRAQPGTVTFLDNPRYLDQLRDTRASACLVGPKHRESVPPRCAALVVAEPQRAFADLVGRLYPEALRPGSVFGAAGIAPNSSVHPEARLEPGVTVDPGAVIGPRAEIGSGTVIGANAVIGPDVRIGRDCSIGPQSTVVFALIADRVIVHPGVRIGQDGFGFAMSARGHSKVPQIGRVIIQNDVEIGANTCIDRGHNRDTIIGEGTKIDNLVQIGHNVTVGRHCVIVSQTGISGSCDLADFVTLGGQAGLSGHLKIGQGAQIGAQSGVAKDVPVGAKWSGSPARPLREQYRMRAIVDRLLRESATRSKADRSEEES